MRLEGAASTEWVKAQIHGGKEMGGTCAGTATQHTGTHSETEKQTASHTKAQRDQATGAAGKGGTTLAPAQLRLLGCPLAAVVTVLQRRCGCGGLQ